jgi:hypothetical protein
VPVRKSRIVVFPFPSSARSGPRELTTGESSRRFWLTLFFPLSYLDFRGTAISFGRESWRWESLEGSLVVLGRTSEETLDFFPSGNGSPEVVESMPVLFLVNCNLDPSGNSSSPKPSIWGYLRYATNVVKEKMVSKFIFEESSWTYFHN